MQAHSWLLGIERFDPSEYHPEDLERIPEIGLHDGDEEGEDDEWEDADSNQGDGEGFQPTRDEKCMTLTITNVKDTTNVCFVTVWDVDLCGSDGKVLTSGWNCTQHLVPKATSADCIEETASTNGNCITKRRKCTTFIVLCPPQTFVHLCYLAPNQFIPSNENLEDDKVPLTSWSQVEIESDIQPWSCHENVNDEHSTLIHFPFCEVKDTDNLRNDNTPESHKKQRQNYQCIQSESGQLTHFFHGNYHAIDFACPIGTPLYSPADGTVVDVHDNSDVKIDGTNDNLIEVSGIAATNLFHWNSVMIRADESTCSNESTNTNSLYVEYVHIQSNSCTVKVGDRVRRGQLLCKSGSVGFSPCPHLHLGAYRSGEDGAASVRVRFNCYGGIEGGEPGSFLPAAGCWYDEHGLVQKEHKRS